MSVLEDFVKDLLREKIIVNYRADRDKVREFYIKNYRQLGKCSFHDFNWELWRGWYINTFTAKTICFDQRWIDYFAKEIGGKRVNLKQFDEDATVDIKECLACNVVYTERITREIHLKSLQHTIRVEYVINEQFFTVDKDIKFELESRNVDNSGNELKLKSAIKQDMNARLYIRNSSTKMMNILEIIQINCFVPEITLQENFHKGILLEPDETVDVDIHAHFEHSTYFLYPIVVVSSVRGTNKEVFNLANIEVEITSEFSYLHSNSRYFDNIPKVAASVIDMDDGIIPGKRPDPYMSSYKETLPLKQYKIPKKLEDLFLELVNKYPQFVAGGTMALRPYNVFCSTLGVKVPMDAENFHSNMEILLHVEENQLRVDVRDYDMEASLKIARSARGLYQLEVPGLAEARPSLLHGDRVYLKENKLSAQKFEGIVHRVMETSVLLGLNHRFDKIFLPNKKFFIQFDFNRRTIRVEKQALSLAWQHNIIPTLYPETIEIKFLSTVPNTIECINRQLNEEQMKAVRNILKPKNIPFVIFGPPGTGKTVTVVESVYQLWKLYPNSRILICAPSNAATNEIAARLVNIIPKSEMFRLLGSAYGTDIKVIKDIEDIANIQKDGEFYMPSMEDLLKRRIIMTTIVTAARLVNGGVPKEHFTHVFIDESGYATETQTLIPIAGILSNAELTGKLTGQIILAGDPEQLTPLVHSLFARHCGYGTSLLERLTRTCKYYSRDATTESYDDRCVTKLLKNYRSHETILKLPSELFYYGKLQAVGNNWTDLFIGWEKLNNEKFPVIFHHVEGEDERDKSSPSFFNVQEIEQVVDYLSKLFESKVKGVKITPGHVGVITPYRKQVEKLKEACSKKKWNTPLIGSVEQFQGKERLVIILSTVRSKNSHKFEKIDQQCQLGFIKNPKRFNVALTRAKALLIVIGNAKVLKTDRYWSKFIQYCSEHHSIKGKSF